MLLVAYLVHAFKFKSSKSGTGGGGGLWRPAFTDDNILILPY